MKHILITLLLGAFLLSVTSCGQGGICNCHVAGMPNTNDTTYTVGRNLSLSAVQAKCNAIQQQNPKYDTCRGQVLKD